MLALGHQDYGNPAVYGADPPPLQVQQFLRPKSAGTGSVSRRPAHAADPIAVLSSDIDRLTHHEVHPGDHRQRGHSKKAEKLRPILSLGFKAELV